jgi:diguanylate cyclase (GGDEF)-like protein
VVLHRVADVEAARLDGRDPLTRLPGYAAGMAALAEAVHPGATGCLLVVDVDGFEELNTTFGSAACDQLLVQTAQRLRIGVPPGTHVARLDGDAFLVVAAGSTPNDPHDLGSQVLGAVTAPLEVAGTPITVTVSVGAARLSHTSADAARSAAHRALRVAKERGGRQVVVEGSGARSFGRRTTDVIAQIEEVEARAARAHAEARTDALTGLPNRRRFDEDCPTLQAQARSTGGPVAAIYLDLDEFGTINRTRGDAAGDHALSQAAAVMAMQCRAEDGVYRKGGEEFVLLLAGTDLAGAVQVAERVRAAIEAAGIPHGGRRSRPVVTATLGVAAGRGPALDLGVVVTRAQEQMRLAKQAGRNQVRPAPDDVPPPDPDPADPDPGDPH